MYNASVSKTKTSQASISKAFLDYQSAAQRDSEMRLYVLVLSVCSFLCLSVYRQNAYTKTRFSQTLSNLELWSLLTSYM